MACQTWPMFSFSCSSRPESPGTGISCTCGFLALVTMAKCSLTGRFKLTDMALTVAP